jgi:ABC-2 type transport system permease protein
MSGALADALHRVAEVTRKEFRQMLRDPRSRRLVFGAPVLQLLLFGYAANTDVRHAPVFLVDGDRTAESRALAAALTATGHFRIAGAAQRPAELAAALDRGAVVMGLEIPAGYARDLRRGDAAVQLIRDGTNANTATIAQGYALRILQRHGVEALGATGAAAPAEALDFRPRIWYNPELRSRNYNVPAVIGLLLLLMCLLLTAMAVVREREAGTLEQLMVSPLRPVELILGKTLPVLVVALLDLGLVTAVALLWFGIPFRGDPATLVAAALVYSAAGLAFGLLISTISRTQQEAFMAMFLFLLPAMILSGFFFPISTMPEVVQWVTLLNPVRHFLEMIRAIFLKGATCAVLWPQFVALTVMAAGAVAAAAWRFRRTLD